MIYRFVALGGWTLIMTRVALSNYTIFFQQVAELFRGLRLQRTLYRQRLCLALLA